MSRLYGCAAGRCFSHGMNGFHLFSQHRQLCQLQAEHWGPRKGWRKKRGRRCARRRLKANLATLCLLAILPACALGDGWALQPFAKGAVADGDIDSSTGHGVESTNYRFEVGFQVVSKERRHTGRVVHEIPGLREALVELSRARPEPAADTPERLGPQSPLEVVEPEPEPEPEPPAKEPPSKTIGALERLVWWQWLIAGTVLTAIAYILRDKIPGLRRKST